MNKLLISLYASATYASETITSGNLPTPKANSTAIGTVLGIAFGIIGAMALLMIAVSGLRYVLSAGDPQKTAQARDSIIYSLVGLTVAIMAEAIVHFVVDRI
jgi:hypothetical protein